MSDFLALTFGASTIQEVTLKGEPVAIRRATGPAGVNRPFTDTVTRAYVRDFEANELVGTITQGDRVAITLVDALADILPVLDSDKLVTDFEVIDGIVLIDDDGHVVGGKASTIKKVKRRKVGGTLIALEIQAAG